MSRKEFTANRARLAAFVAVALLPVAWLGSSADGAGQGERFGNESLRGSYALVGTGGDHDAASVGVTRFDGAGRAWRSLVLNERDPNGDGRVLLTISAEGTYRVNPDGTGVAAFLNELPDGSRVRFTFDFVITEAERGGSGRSHLGVRLHMVQREPGIAATLVVFDLSRLPR